MDVNVDDAFVGFNYKKETTKKITKKMIKKRSRNWFSEDEMAHRHDDSHHQ